MRTVTSGLIGIVVAAWTARASAYSTNPAVPLEDQAKRADLVCKATAISDRFVSDGWFEKYAGWAVAETELRVISMIKGTPRKTFRFRHLAAKPTPGIIGNMSPHNVTFTIGASYLVVAAKGPHGEFRQLEKWPSGLDNAGVLPAADNQPHHGTTLTEAAWAELTALATGPSADAAINAIELLDKLSGGHSIGLSDFARQATLEVVRTLIASSSTTVAAAAIAVFGAESPFSDDRLVMYWLAAIGHGTIPGIGAMKLAAAPAADTAIHELTAAADAAATSDLRARAIRALGGSRDLPAAKLSAWSREPEPVRSAAVLVAARATDHRVIVAAVADASPAARRSAALAIGFTQDPALVPQLAALITDAAPEVREAAALSLESFAVDQVATVLEANLASDYAPLFVNALARANPQPYVARLVEIIVKDSRPARWWGGTIPAFDSWRILFDYLKARPAAELTAGSLDASLDALETMHYGSSSEPQQLYALYVRRGLTERAKRFRELAKHTVSFAMEPYFEMVDKNPASYVQ